MQPLNPDYPRVHVAVAWHPYLEPVAKQELKDQNLLQPGTKMETQPGQWSAELEAQMRKCGVQVYGKGGDVD